MGINWTDEIIEKLTEHFKDGLTASASATRLTAEFGIDFTRNMVIGKRIRWGMRTDPVTSRLNSKRAAKKAGGMFNKPRAKPAPTKPPTNFTATSPKTGLFVSGVSLPKEPLPKEESPSDYAKLYSLDELTKSMCRWPIGDPKAPDFGFCGKDKVTGLPYCEHHARRAYRAPEPRIRRPAVERIPTIADLENA